MTSNDPRRCHYDVLGVSKDSTNEEVKAAFRKLSMQTHPDLAGAGACPERFKNIANAASVLSNPKQRQLYDQRLEERGNSLHHHFRTNRPIHGYGASASERPPHGLTALLVSLFRPRNLVLGPIAFFAAVSGIQYALGIDNKKQAYREESNLVQVWKNPETGNYETPAPWDPVYQRLQPELEYVPKDQVRLRKQ